MDATEAPSHDLAVRTASPPPKAMELGFQANLGPLSQIGIQLCSPETAVYLATKGLGWWKARRRVESLQQVLGASGASLTPIDAFKTKRYVEGRRQHPLHGVTRQDGQVRSHVLPCAGNTAYGDPGLWCFHGMATALLCFFDVNGASSILVDVLPAMLHFEQRDMVISKEGPLSSAVKAMVTQVLEEEKMSKRTEILLRYIEKKRENVSPASLQDMQVGPELDSALVTGFLLWLAVDYSKREKHRYPTRSLLIWCIAGILEEIGFGAEASDYPVTTREQYNHIFDEEGTELEVHFVPANIGPTDPNVRPSTKIAVISHVRVHPIRDIPMTELRQHVTTKNPLVGSLCNIWAFTFDHVQKYLRKQSHIQKMIGAYAWNTEHEDSTAIPLILLDEHQKQALTVLPNPHTRSSPESLLELLARPIQQYIVKYCDGCKDTVHAEWSKNWCWSDDGEDETAVPRKEHNKEQKLVMRTILLAAAYAVVCLFVKDRDGTATLDSEVAYVPSRGNSISDCFSLQSEDRNWIFRVFSIAAVGKAQKGSTRTESGRVQFTGAVFSAISGFSTGQFIAPETFGGYSNGLTMISNFLLDPAQSSSYHTFTVSFGHPIDLPLDENSLINSVVNDGDLRVCPVQLSESVKDPGNSEDHQLHQYRWDIDPDWAHSETEIHFRCRINGVVQTAIPPYHMMRSLLKHSVTTTPCICMLSSQSTSSIDSTDTLAEFQHVLDIRFVDFAAIRWQSYTRLFTEAGDKNPGRVQAYCRHPPAWDKLYGAMACALQPSPGCSGTAEHEATTVFGALLGLWVEFHCG